MPSTSSISASSVLARKLSTTPLVNAQPATEPSAGARTLGAKNALEAHTVEDLKGMAHVDILAETGTRRDAEMRHFTGMSFFCLLLFFFLDCTYQRLCRIVNFGGGIVE